MTMLPGIPTVPLLADGEGIGAVITILVVVIGWIANLISNKNQKGPPVANRPRPPARPRDERLQQEINIFIEDAGGQRSRKTPPRPTAQAPRQAAKPKRPPEPVANKSARRPRPGEELATRQAPVTESLGAGVKQHLSTFMSDKVSREVQQRLAPQVDQKVAEDLGRAVATGATGPAPAVPSASLSGRPERLAELLRNRTGIQQAIVMNVVLAPRVADACVPPLN